MLPAHADSTMTGQWSHMPNMYEVMHGSGVIELLPANLSIIPTCTCTVCTRGEVPRQKLRLAMRSTVASELHMRAFTSRTIHLGKPAHTRGLTLSVIEDVSSEDK